MKNSNGTKNLAHPGEPALAGVSKDARPSSNAVSRTALRMGNSLVGTKNSDGTRNLAHPEEPPEGRRLEGRTTVVQRKLVDCAQRDGGGYCTAGAGRLMVLVAPRPRPITTATAQRSGWAR